MITPVSRRLVILSTLVFAAGTASLPAADDFPPLFPFVISHDAPDNATSVSHRPLQA